MPTTLSPTASSALTRAEWRANLSLASIFGLRMLGLFMVVPVFAHEAAQYPGGDNTGLIGLTLGIYGLTQAALQFVYGLASDRFGRKPVIIAGLLVFAAGSTVAALAPSLLWLSVGRALQGAGAVSAAVTALLADQTRDEVRTKSMALLGASMGLTFALSLVVAPVLAAWGGLVAIFALTALLSLLGIAAVLWWVPPEPLQHRLQQEGRGLDVLRLPELLRLNYGGFVMHGVQLAMWLAVPSMLVEAGLPQARHWQLYLPVLVGSFVVMGGSFFQLEKHGYVRAAFLTAVALMALVQLGLWWQIGLQPSIYLLGLLLFLFFYGFNVLEACLPSMVSRLAPLSARGAAIGVYNTMQSIGFFAGGLLGGWAMQWGGPHALFTGCGVLMMLWLWLAWPMTMAQTKTLEAPANP
ncbi:MFS transporter [Rhodoferax sp. U11-2br]|uniref:MFS transporter n=1 Tax=Rhodoferax sp. U11-2br TaxID=2838878 RepID=UPI0020374F32|nr:MFS transporter [Rhodoferax sp. U11-2br]